MPADKDFLDRLNPDSLTVLTGCKVEPEMRKVAAEFDKQENRTLWSTHFPVHAGGLLLSGQPGLHGGASGVYTVAYLCKDSFKK